MTDSDEAHVRDIADSLIGCCGGSRPDVESAVDEFDAEQCALFDTLCFLCDVCGWWCDAEEMRSDQICEECEHEEAEN